MAFVPLEIEDLRLGMYVKLKCSWFKHPFSTNTFKVTSTQDLQTIKKISDLKLYYDPDLSDLDFSPSSETLEEQRPTLYSEEEPPIQDSDAPEEEISPLTAPPAEEDVVKSAWEEKEIRMDAFRERREQLRHTERAYFDSVRMT